MKVELDLNEWEIRAIYILIKRELYREHVDIEGIRNLLILHDKIEKVKKEISEEEDMNEKEGY